MAVSVQHTLIAVAASLLVSCSAAQFSADQCRLMRLMRVTTQGQCPAGVRDQVQVRSLQADEASYAPSINGGVNAGLGSSGADNVAGGVPGDGVGGIGGPGSGAGGPGTGVSGPGTGDGGPGSGAGGPGDGDRPGGGGDGRPGGGGAPRPPNPPGIVIVKPGGGTITLKPDGKPPSREDWQAVLKALRERREQGDFVQPDRPKGKAKQGRNSK